MTTTKRITKKPVDKKRNCSNSAALKSSQRSVRTLQSKLNAVENKGATMHFTNREIEYLKEQVYAAMVDLNDDIRFMDDEWKNGVITRHAREKNEFAEKLYRKLCFDE